LRLQEWLNNTPRTDPDFKTLTDTVENAEVAYERFDEQLKAKEK
jgi:hypothetical protein